MIFAFEAVIKILAMGFIIHKKSYLRDGWNWIDFLVVCTGLIELAQKSKQADKNEEGTNWKALRTLRVLRPLRSINAFPSMRKLIGALLWSLKGLVNAVILILFIILIFGILGVRQFKGVQY